MADFSFATIRKRKAQADQVAATWRETWRDVYRFTMPERLPLIDRTATSPQSYFTDIYDSTGLRAVEEFASFVFQSLTPLDQRWLKFSPRFDLKPKERERLNEAAEAFTAQVWSLISDSNYGPAAFAANKDLAVGTKFMRIEIDPRDRTKISFEPLAAPLFSIDEDITGRIAGIFLTRWIPVRDLPALLEPRGISLERLSQAAQEQLRSNPNSEIQYVCATVFHWPSKSWLTVEYEEGAEHALYEKKERTSPIVVTRWSKTPGQVWGIGPTMRALPDIRTLNKTVELMLMNASIAVSGVWQADDDGVLNPATVRLVPGAIIPKRPGSAGLTPLESPGRFDVSQLILEDLRRRVEMAHSNIRLPEREMTALETQERMREAQRELRGTFGQLLHEDLKPTIDRVIDLGRQIGKLEEFDQDEILSLELVGPLMQAIQEVEGMKLEQLINNMNAILGPEITKAALELPEVVELLREARGVSPRVIKSVDELHAEIEKAAQLTQQMMEQGIAAQGGGKTNGAAIGL